MAFDLNKADFKKQLENYNPKDLEEKVFKQKMLSLLQYDNCFDRSLLHAHFTGSAWVVDPGKEKVLLTHHAKLDKWLQLGGHADGQANMAEVAFRELREESGIDQFSLASNQIFDIDIHCIPLKKDVPEHDHYDVRFLFQGNADNQVVKNHESKELRWVSYHEVANLVNNNKSIIRMLNKSIEMAF